MATSKGVSCLSLFISQCEIQFSSKVFQVRFILCVLLGCASAGGARSSPQQYVYASASSSPAPSVVPGFSKAGQTGVLNLVPGSPFNERFEGGLVAIDGQGKFLFVLNPLSNDISVFQINQATGALFEVPGSPFQVPPTINPNLAPSQPISIGTEKSGKFLFVGYYMSGIQGSSAVVTLAIDASGLNPVLLTTHSIETRSGGAPAQLLTDPKGLRLYVGLSRGQNGLQVGGAEIYSIDAASGALGFMGFADSPPAEGHSVALDPLGRFFFVGWGGNIGAVDSCVLSPVDGTAVLPCASLQLALAIFPETVVAENSGKFLYVTRSDGTVVNSIDQTTGALNPLLGPISAILFSPGSVVADPMGPFIYSVSTVGVHVFQVDQQSGNLAEISGSPFNAGMSGITRVTGLAISGAPIQAVSGPAATIFPSTGYSGGTVAVGSSGQTGLFSLVNTGGQNLSISSISISGPNVSSFSQSNTCALTLAPNANCSISINFMPASVGALSATLQVADNAPGSPQTLALQGTGSSPAPAITFSPTVPSFPTITQGTAGAAQMLTVMSTGTAPLHVSSVTIGGANASDFSLTNNCAAPVAPSSSCTISLVFSPLGPGMRAANLMVTDDAPASPQTISLSATANPAFTAGPAPNGSTAASVTAGQTAQYLLQLTPGPGYGGSVSLACSGAPLGAVCQFPASVPIASGAPAPFTVTVSTKGAGTIPPSIPRRFVPPAGIRVLPLLAFALILAIVAMNRRMFDDALRPGRLAWSAALTAILLCSLIDAAGCGSSVTTPQPNITTPPPPIITPSGTSTITISMTATSLAGQPLQLQPLLLALTVK